MVNYDTVNKFIYIYICIICVNVLLLSTGNAEERDKVVNENTYQIGE